LEFLHQVGNIFLDIRRCFLIGKDQVGILIDGGEFGGGGDFGEFDAVDQLDFARSEPKIEVLVDGVAVHRMRLRHFGKSQNEKDKNGRKHAPAWQG
jgi:hypothetical protein